MRVGFAWDEEGRVQYIRFYYGKETDDGWKAEPGNEEGSTAEAEQEARPAEEGERRQAGQVESLVHEWDDDPNIDDLITERRPANYCRVCGAELW